MSVFNVLDLENIPKSPQEEELSNVLCAGKTGRIERLVSTGQCSPAGFWYDQIEDEWIVLLSGEATISFENETIQLKTGDSLLIPAHKRHRVERTGTNPPCIWLCVFGHYHSEENFG